MEKEELNLENNLDRYVEIFEIMCFTNKNYILDYDDIDILLSYEKLIFELVETD